MTLSKAKANRDLQRIRGSKGSGLESITWISGFSLLNPKVADLSPIHVRKQAATDGT